MNANEAGIMTELEGVSEYPYAETGQPVSAVYAAVKRALDFGCSLLAVVLLSPVMLAISAAIWLTSEGPAIYKHTRIGFQGREIQVYKFRTMVNDAENIEKYFTYGQYLKFQRNYKLENDPRITKLGRFLRTTSLDELPQFVNILKGQMSIVGPRPIIRSELERYGQYADTYMSVKPGLTGLWQVNGRSCTTYEERVLLDVKYVNTRSLINDLKLILKTFKVVLSRNGAC